MKKTISSNLAHWMCLTAPLKPRPEGFKEHGFVQVQDIVLVEAKVW